MKKRLKRWLICFGLAVVFGIVALNALAYKHAYAMMHFTAGSPRTHEPEKLTLGQKAGVLFCGVNIPRPRSSARPVDLSPETRTLTFDCTNGIKLGAWYSPSGNKNQLVILFHGYSAEKSGTLPQAKAFLELGVSVLLVDFRGSGDSSESYTTAGFAEAEDVAAAARYAREKLAHRQVVLYGQSMGAAAILRSVRSCGVQPDGIIVEAIFDKMLNTVRHRFEAMGVPSFPSAQLLVFWGGRQAGFNGFRHNPVDYASAVTCPILFLHGAADPRAILEEGRRVFNAVRARKDFKEFSELGHEDPLIRYPDEWKTVVSAFLSSLENPSSASTSAAVPLPSADPHNRP